MGRTRPRRGRSHPVWIKSVNARGAILNDSRLSGEGSLYVLHSLIIQTGSLDD